MTISPKAIAWTVGGAILVSTYIGMTQNSSSGTSPVTTKADSSASTDSSSASYSGPSSTKFDDVPPGYESLIANVWEGNPLYLRTDLSYIGTIVGMERNHVFLDGSEREGVLVQFRNGSVDWIPRKTLQRIYVTK
jgi:hypothetical protein